MKLELTGRTAVVTGASRGIGLAVARALADGGANVLGGARTISPELKEITPRTASVDLTTTDGPAALIAQARDELGGIDILVNNVGGRVGPQGGFQSLRDADWLGTFDLTLFSAVRTIRAALPDLLAGSGVIVNIGSVNARLALPQLGAYAAAKAALASLGKSLAEEFGGRGLRVNTVSPGPVLTDAWTAPGGNVQTMADQAGISYAEMLERVPSATGLSTGRTTGADEVAALVVFLASGVAPNISGSDYVIDGGMLKEI